MSTSDRLGLPYMAPQQAQKHVTYNEAVRSLDAIVQAAVEDRDLAAPPTSPASGAAYIAASGASGDWAGGDNCLFAYQDGVWTKYAPKDGWVVWVKDEGAAVVWNGALWTGFSAGAGGGLSAADLAAGAAAMIGVNTQADGLNRLVVKSDAVLFNHDDVTPGSGDCRVKINKNGVGDTASHLFQTESSGRAEFGLTGDDDFHVKVSADGSSWIDAMMIDKDTGNIGIGTSTPAAKLDVFDGAIRVIASDNGRLLELTDLSGAANNGAMRIFNDAGAENARIASIGNSWISGNVGIGETTPGARLHIDGGGVLVGNPTGGDKGVGAINASAVYDDNTLLSCYVFDQALDGAIDADRWHAKAPDRIEPAVKENPGTDEEVVVTPEKRTPSLHQPMLKFRARAGSRHDPLTLDGYARHWKEKRHLSSMPNEAKFDIEQGMATGEWIQRLVETVEIQAVLIEQLNARTQHLEGAAP